MQTNLAIRIDALEQETDASVGDRSSHLRHFVAEVSKWATGTSALQQNRVYSTTSSVTAGVPVAYDLRGIADPLTGGTVEFESLTLICVRHNGTTASQTLTIGGGSNPVDTVWAAAGDASVIGPGGVWLWTSPRDGAATTAGTADTLTLTASSGSVSFDLLILGRQS